MDNPEHHRISLARRFSLRRRSTASSRKISGTSNLLGKKSHLNPYVGWFRHSPSTVTESSSSRHFVAELAKKERLLYKETSIRKSLSIESPSSLNFHKHSPHVGWFRHSPPSGVTLSSLALERETAWLLSFLRHGLANTETIKNQKFLSQSARRMFVSGRLRGGGGTDDDRSLVRSFRESSFEGTLETVKVLSKLAWWFLFPVAYDSDPLRFREQRSAPWSSPVEDAIEHFLDNLNANAVSRGAETMPEKYPSEAVEEETQVESDSDNDDISTSSELSAVSSLPHDLDIPIINDLSLSVSSLAEAYYAHYAALEYATLGGPAFGPALGSLDDENPSRLDYIMSQMSRNTSRHLDIQTILSLPVITFEGKTNTRGETRAKLSESCESWMIVDAAQRGQNGESLCEEEVAAPAAQEEDGAVDVCVICLEAFVPGDRLRVLPCNHSFHTGCIDRWLSGSLSSLECYTAGCPTCKEHAVSDEIQDGSVPSWAFAQVGSALL